MAEHEAVFNHNPECYHNDCDEDDFEIHGCDKSCEEPNTDCHNHPAPDCKYLGMGLWKCGVTDQH